MSFTTPLGMTLSGRLVAPPVSDGEHQVFTVAAGEYLAVPWLYTVWVHVGR